MIPIAFVDDYAPFRNLLSEHLEKLPNGFRVYQYDDGKDFVTRFPKENYTPSIVLMDIKMGNMNGYETTAWIKKHYPAIPVLIFSDMDDTEAIVCLVRCGANGHTNKRHCFPPTRLLEAMAQVMSGKTYFDNPDMYAFVKKSLAMPKEQLIKGFESLTERELPVIRYILLHKTPKQAAKELYISTEGYKSRRKSIFRKLGIQSTETLLEKAKRWGLI